MNTSQVSSLFLLCTIICFVQQWILDHLGTKVMVSSGWNGSARLDSTEVVDLKSGKIFSMAPLGRRTSSATGGLLDGLPVICGGWYDYQIHSIAKDQSKF